VSRNMSLMLADPQTAGGLLISVPADRTEGLVSRLNELKTPAASRIGRITEKQDKHILVHP
jgi:selenophosphate synthase